jgi:hypothetical protein
MAAPGSPLSERGAALVRRQASFVKLNRHDTEEVDPLGLVQEDLAQLGLGGFLGQEEIKPLVETL